MWIHSNNLFSNVQILEAGANEPINQHFVAFRTLTLVAGHQEEHPTHKCDVDLVTQVTIKALELTLRTVVDDGMCCFEKG